MAETTVARIPAEAQLRWLEQHIHVVPEYLRPLVTRRFAKHTDRDDIFQHLLTLEGMVALYGEAMEEDADYWVYMLVLLCGLDLVRRYYRAELAQAETAEVRRMRARPWGQG